MGDILFIILHLVAVAFVGPIWLMLTIPLHLIYVAINEKSYSKKVRHDENFIPKNVKSKIPKRKDKESPILLEIITFVVIAIISVFFFSIYKGFIRQ